MTIGLNRSFPDNALYFDVTYHFSYTLDRLIFESEQ